MIKTFITPTAWVRLSARRRFASGRPIAQMVALTLVVITAIAYQVVAAIGQVSAQTTSAGVLSQIVVTPQANEATDVGITAKLLAGLRAISGVERVNVDAEIGLYAADGNTWATTVRPLNLENLPPEVSLQDGAAMGTSDVIVPSTVDGEVFSVTPGSTFPVAFTRMTSPGQGELAERTLTVAGTYDAQWLGEGRATFLATCDLVIELLAAKHGLSSDDYLATTGVPGALVTAVNADMVTQVTAAIQELGLEAAPVRDSLGELPGVVAHFPVVLMIVIGGFLLLLILNVSSAVRAAVTIRRNEFALLRIRGWTKADIRKALLVDIGGGACRGAAVGTIAGLVLGAVISQTVLPTVTFTATFVGALIMMVAALIAVPTLVAGVTSWVSSARIQRSDPFLTVMQPG